MGAPSVLMMELRAATGRTAYTWEFLPAQANILLLPQRLDELSLCNKSFAMRTRVTSLNLCQYP